MGKALSVLKSHWPAILAFGVAAYAQFGPAIAAWISAHPKYASWTSVITFVVGYYVRSPLTPAVPKA